MPRHPSIEDLGEPALKVAGLQVWVHGRAHPDEAWLRVTAHCGGAGASVFTTGSILEVTDLVRFGKQCALLREGKVERAVLESYEDDLSGLIDSPDSTGHLRLRVEISPDPLRQKHAFEFEIDQSYLPGLIRQCRDLGRKYPARKVKSAEVMHGTQVERAGTRMVQVPRPTQRPWTFRLIAAFLTVSILLMLAGQTMSVFDYDLTVRLGLQESLGEVGEHGVQVNRAFGAGDTIVYIPLMVASLIGLWRRKRWALLTTAAVFGVSAYWSVTITSMLAFLPGVPGYTLRPGAGLWLFVGAYAVIGVWGLFYLMLRGDALVGRSER